MNARSFITYFSYSESCPSYVHNGRWLAMVAQYRLHTALLLESASYPADERADAYYCYMLRKAKRANLQSAS